MGGAAMIILLSCLAFLCQEKVLASVNDLLKDGQDLNRILDIEGMELKNDMLYFNGEEVQELQEVKRESAESEELEVSGEPGDYSLGPSPRFGYKKYKEDILDNVEEVTPIKNIQAVKSLQEIKKMLPIKSIQEIKSIKEIESIEEIKDKLARSFIRSHGLKNLINDEGGVSGEYEQPSDTTNDLNDLRDRMVKDTKQCRILKRKVKKKQKEIAIMQEIEDQHCKAAQIEVQEYKTLKEKIEAALDSKVSSIEPIKSIEEVKSITPIKSIDEIESMTSVESIQEVKSITPIESIQEVKHMYELTEEQAQLLKDLVNGNKYPSRYPRQSSSDYVVSG